MTQTARLLDYLRLHPGASSYEITLHLHIVNVTGRISDLRAKGHRIDCDHRPDGEQGYYVRQPRPVTTGVQEAAW